jgi:hypothetical protein
MKKINTIKHWGIVLIIFLVCSCKKERSAISAITENEIQTAAIKNNRLTNTSYGPLTDVGNGKMRTYITMTHKGVPIELGIQISESALSGLSKLSNETFSIPLDNKAQGVTNIDHVEVNWEPQGGFSQVYSAPHFNFYFYTISKNTQMAIPPYQLVPTGFDILPPVGIIPASYSRYPGGTARVGVNWIDLSSPEYNGQPFTYTYIYGSYNGKLSFYNTMVTLDFLKNSFIDQAIPQPTLFAKSNVYYHTHYGVSKRDGNYYYISLTNLVMH